MFLIGNAIHQNVSNENLNVGKCSTTEKSVCNENIDFNYTVVKAKLFKVKQK